MTELDFDDYKAELERRVGELERQTRLPYADKEPADQGWAMWMEHRVCNLETKLNFEPDKQDGVGTFSSHTANLEYRIEGLEKRIDAPLDKLTWDLINTKMKKMQDCKKDSLATK